MEIYRTIRISPFFSIFVDLASREYDLSDQVKSMIEDIWAREYEIRKGQLYNGKLLSFVALENERVLGRFVDYKYYLVQTKEPSLKAVLRIEPISISGICTAKNKVLVGQRSDSVTQYPGLFELVPSGGIEPSSLIVDRVDLTKQFYNELLDEAGIGKKLVKKITPFAFVHDLRKESYEICANIHLAHEALNASEPPPAEYSKLLWMTKDQLQQFISENEDKFVPFSRYLIELQEEYKHHEII